ncbi:MAG: PilZ domain-containing protein [Spirochaetaceae bacterium]|nr:PilZ domain-containing protein [Spirochaetaceae bacterium]
MSVAVSRIEREFILKTLMGKKAPVEVRYFDQWISGLISDVDDAGLKLQLDADDIPVPGGDATVSVFFRFRGARMTFHARALSVRALENGKEMKTTLPEGVYRDLSRGYERVIPSAGIMLSFMVQGEKVVLNFPQSEISEEPPEESPEEPETMPNFDATKMTNILKAFREKAQTFSSENKIVMFRERHPENFEEKLIAATGKTFLYPQSISKNTPEKDLILSPRVLAQEEIILSQRNQGAELFRIIDILNKIGKDKDTKNILHELYSPILYRNYVVGYLYLVSFRDGGQKFSQKIIDFVFQFGRLLIHSLRVNGYFKGEPVKERVDSAEVVDISASGIQFTLPLQQFDNALLLYKDINFDLIMGERNLKIGGRIMRKFSDHGRLYICVMFLDITDEDRFFLMEALYGTTETPDFYPSSEDWTV